MQYLFFVLLFYFREIFVVFFMIGLLLLCFLLWYRLKVLENRVLRTAFEPKSYQWIQKNAKRKSLYSIAFQLDDRIVDDDIGGACSRHCKCEYTHVWMEIFQAWM